MSDNYIDRLFSNPEFQKKSEEQGEKNRAKTKYYKRNLLQNVKRWQEKHPLEVKARSAVHHAVRSGKLVRGMCFINDQYCHGRTEAHHIHGYTKEHWLDVVWLCKYHHELADTRDDVK